MSFVIVQFSWVQSLSRVWLFATPWIAARQASLSITISQSSVKLMSIELVMPSSHLILCHSLLLLPQSLPASESFPMSQLFAWGGQSTGASASASFLPKNTQGWSPLEWTGWISLSTTVLIPMHMILIFWGRYYCIIILEKKLRHIVLICPKLHNKLKTNFNIICGFGVHLIQYNYGIIV